MYNSVFFLVLLGTVILLVRLRRYNFLAVVISTYISLIFASLIVEYLVGVPADRRDSIDNEKADVLLISPSSFLNLEDGRGSENILSDYVEQISPVAFPLGGSPNSRTVYCEENSGPLIYLSDRYGFKNKDSLWNSRDHDFILIGDSFAHGACEFKSAQERLNELGLSVVSLGMGGNGPLTSLGALREYLVGHRSERVYHLIVSNDYSRQSHSDLEIDFKRELGDEVLNRYLNDPGFSQGYFAPRFLENLRDFIQAESNELMSIRESERSMRMDRILAWFTCRSLARFLHQRVFSATLVALRQPVSDSSAYRFLSTTDANKLKAVYEKMDQLARENGSILSFVVIPEKRCLNGDTTEVNYISSLLKTTRIPDRRVLNLWSNMCNEAFFSRTGSHYNSLGYLELARLLAEDFGHPAAD